MSNIYITEPNTEGKVIFHTSLGDLDVELWPKEAPKACRNFIQLALEKFYDHTIFHRLIPNFILQGGDPRESNNALITTVESIYGPQGFADEIHSRLKFNHRGLLAMANENRLNTNHTQFFFTLDACEFLNKKHTIFGKITGNTIFNLLNANSIDTDANDRPTELVTLKSIEVLWNPFDDIVPREIRNNVCRNDGLQPEKKVKKTKNFTLLSFGEEAEGQEMAVAKLGKAKVSSSHDVGNDKTLSSAVDSILQSKVEKVSADLPRRDIEDLKTRDTTRKMSFRDRISKLSNLEGESLVEKSRESDLENRMAEKIREKRKQFASSLEDLSMAALPEAPTSLSSLNPKKIAKQKSDEYSALREDIKKARKATPVITGEKARKQQSARAFHDMLTPLQQQRQKYLAQKKTYGNRQKNTLEMLSKFTSTLMSQNHVKHARKEEAEAYSGQVFENDESDEDLGDKSWMSTKLKFKKHIDDQYRLGFDPSAEDYVTIDTKIKKDEGEKSKLYLSGRDGDRSTERRVRRGGDSLHDGKKPESDYRSNNDRRYRSSKDSLHSDRKRSERSD